MFYFSDDERVKKWCRWMQTIESHLIELHYNRAVWRRMQEIVVANPAVPASTWWAFLSGVYSKGQAAGVRRVAGSSAGGGASRRPLLEQIAADSARLSRAEYLRPWRGDHTGILKQYEDWWNAEMAPQGGDHVDPMNPQADLAALKVASGRVEDYVDRLVAHADPRPFPGEMPTLGEVDTAIDAATALYQKTATYFLVVCRSSTPSCRMGGRRSSTYGGQPPSKPLGKSVPNTPALTNKGLSSNAATSAEAPDEPEREARSWVPLSERFSARRAPAAAPEPKVGPGYQRAAAALTGKLGFAGTRPEASQVVPGRPASRPEMSLADAHRVDVPVALPHALAPERVPLTRDDVMAAAEVSELLQRPGRRSTTSRAAVSCRRLGSAALGASCGRGSKSCSAARWPLRDRSAQATGTSTPRRRRRRRLRCPR